MGQDKKTFASESNRLTRYPIFLTRFMVIALSKLSIRNEEERKLKLAHGYKK